MNQKRIIKNSVFLYIRMGLVTIVALFTSRLVLKYLGVEDYGIYNVVGGLVAMFSMLSGSLSSAVSRFLSYELGVNNIKRLERVFASSVLIHVWLSIGVFVFAQIIGLIFVNFYMVYDSSRTIAVNWVLQMSILTFCVSLIQVPYNAVLIARENMQMFAYMGILEVICKLAIAYFLTISGTLDKLILYSVMMLAVTLIVTLFYVIYAMRHYKEARAKLLIDKSAIKDIGSFAGWNMVGTVSSILRAHGTNILINIFCGPSVNAARAISFQVNTVMLRFSESFMTALNPPIIKSYAENDLKLTFNLVFRGSKYGFFLIIMPAIPLLFNTEYVLDVWLDEVPKHTVLFVQLILIYTLIEVISSPLITTFRATGRIKAYQLVVGGVQILNFPISWILLKEGFFPEITMYVFILISIVCLILRVIMLHYLVSFPCKSYSKAVIFPIIAVSFTCFSIGHVINLNISSPFVSLFFSSFFSLLFVPVIIYLLGCSSDERAYLSVKFKSIINSILCKK